jgi:alpha-ribazole phosphatase
MDIYLIRHTKTDTFKGLCYGQSDVGLAESFLEEAQQLQQKLYELKANSLVFSSPLIRCVKMAKMLSENVTTDARLLELDFGDWEGRYFNDIDSDVLQQWTDNFVHEAPPNGESFVDLCQRVGAFLGGFSKWNSPSNRTNFNNHPCRCYSCSVSAYFKTATCQCFPIPG